MEYRAIEGKSIEQLVLLLARETDNGWELAGTPVYYPRSGVGTFFAIIRKDSEQQQLRDRANRALDQYTELCEALERDRAALAEFQAGMRRELGLPPEPREEH